jgi:hypothetical protein
MPSHRPLRLFGFTLVIVLATLVLTAGTAAAQNKTEPATSQAKPRFQLSRETVMPPEFETEARKLNRVQDLAKKGMITSDEVAVQASIVTNLERRITFLLTLRSEGGTLADFLEVTSPEKGKGVSLTLINAGEPADLEVKLPAFTLQRVHWGTVVEVLSKLLVAQGLELSYSGGDASNPAEAKAVICVLRRATPLTANGSSPSTFAALGLSEYIYRDQTVETITDAIRVAWKMDPKRDVSALQLQFHPSTKILLVSGPYPAVAIAREIVENLGKKKPLL